MTVKPTNATPSPTAKKATEPSLDAIQTFGDESNMFFDWSAFTKGKRSDVVGVALEKFNLLSTFRDTWSNKLYKPQVFLADVEEQKTVWLAVECDHGNQAWVFTPEGKPLASAFMPETGDSFSWERGFHLDEYAEHTVVKSNSKRD